MELKCADVGILPTSDTQNRQESSLRGNPSHRVQTPVRFVPKDPFVATRRTDLASHPNIQGMDTLRLGDLHCKLSETSRTASLSSRSRNQFCSFTRGNIIIHFIVVI